ncbi:MAG TPA: DUF1344 domain-containing protein [Rhizomicrobium sp.]|nr:DUF1344 domain-containing protein [Rhizomicrobium sp.]
MIKTSTALFTCALAVLSSSVWASTEVQGTITRIDPGVHQITLDGTSYAVARGVNLAGLAVGDTVSLNVEPRRGEKPLVSKLAKIG